MAYLIDTNIIVDFTRGRVIASDYLESLGPACVISSITALEVIAGARDQREVNDLDVLLSIYRHVAPTEEIARRAYYLMKTHAKSRGLGTIDSLIAATALEEGLTLTTKNQKHFSMIRDLDLVAPSY